MATASYIVVDETEYIMSNTKIMESIREGERAIAEGNVKVTKLEDLWKRNDLRFLDA